MKRLIVNADDFGAGPDRDAGILEARERGIVRSISAFARAEAPGGDVGLHLDLSEGRPLVEGHRTLVGPDGRFWGKDEARRRALEGRFDPAEVERETEAQLRRFRPRRLDGHQHLHIFGSVSEPIARAAERAGVRWVRRPVDLLDEPSRPQVGLYRKLWEPSAAVYARHGLRWTDHFLGGALTGSLDAARLIAALAAVPEGLTELMVHPGRDGDARVRELEALTHPDVLAEVKRRNIELIAFADLC